MTQHRVGHKRTTHRTSGCLLHSPTMKPLVDESDHCVVLLCMFEYFLKSQSRCHPELGSLPKGMQPNQGRQYISDSRRKLIPADWTRTAVQTRDPCGHRYGCRNAKAYENTVVIAVPSRHESPP